METAININSVPNQLNQKMINQDKDTIVNGNIFLNLFQDMLLGTKDEGAESPKEEQLKLVSKAIFNDFDLSEIDTSFFNETVEDTEETSFNTDDVMLESLLGQLQTVFQNSSNLADDFIRWYGGLNMDQKRSFDAFILQWQANTNLLNENQQLDVDSLLNQLTNEPMIMHEMISSLLKDTKSMRNNVMNMEVQVVNSNSVEQWDLNKNQNQPLLKENPLFPTAVAQVDFTKVNNLNDEILQHEKQQSGMTSVNNSLENEATPIDLRQLQSSFTHTLFATREGQSNPMPSSIVYGEVNAKDFSSELGKLMMKNIKHPNGVTEMKIQLHPHELGKIDINLTSQHGNLTAIFLADSVVGKEMLESSLHLLKHSLIQQGIQIDRIEVANSTSSNVLSGDNSNHHLPFNQQNSGYHQQNSKGFYLEDEPQLWNEEDLHELMDIDEVSGSLLETRGINYTV